MQCIKLGACFHVLRKYPVKQMTVTSKGEEEKTFISKAASRTQLCRVRQPATLWPSSLSLIFPATRASSAPRSPVADINRPLARSRLLSLYWVSGTVLGAGDGVVYIPDLAPAPGKWGSRTAAN